MLASDSAVGQQEESPKEQRAPWPQRLRLELLLAPVVLALIVVLWDTLVRWRDYPAFILPAPELVVRCGPCRQIQVG